jgi:proprotein convertase subtilisin/kexin type 5
MRVLNNMTKKCDCPTYYYYDTMISTVCASCNYTCYSCSGSAITCTSCLNSTFRNLSGSTCPCINGYYNILNQPVCQECSYQCVTCQGDASNCTLCSAANFRNNTPSCSCINGYYDNNTAVCLACDYSC